MDKDYLLNVIRSSITSNGNYLITGQILQDVLVSVIETLYNDLFLKTNIAQEKGNNADLVMSQASITDELNKVGLSTIFPVDRILDECGLVQNAQYQGIPAEIIFVKRATLMDETVRNNIFVARTGSGYYVSWVGDADYNTAGDSGIIAPIKHRIFVNSQDKTSFVITDSGGMALIGKEPYFYEVSAPSSEINIPLNGTVNIPISIPSNISIDKPTLGIITGKLGVAGDPPITIGYEVMGYGDSGSPISLAASSVNSLSNSAIYISIPFIILPLNNTPIHTVVLTINNQADRLMLMDLKMNILYNL